MLEAKTEPTRAAEMRARQAGEAAAQHVGQQLGLDEVDAHPLGDVLVLADGHPRAAKTGRAQAPGHERHDSRTGERDVVDLDRSGQEVRRRHVDRLGDVEDSARPAEHRLEQVRPRQDPDDLAEPKGGDREVVAPDAAGSAGQGPAPNSIANRTANGTACQNDHPGDPVLGRRGQEADRVGADGDRTRRSPGPAGRRGPA